MTNFPKVCSSIGVSLYQILLLLGFFSGSYQNVELMSADGGSLGVYSISSDDTKREMGFSRCGPLIPLPDDPLNPVEVKYRKSHSNSPSFNSMFTTVERWQCNRFKD